MVSCVGGISCVQPLLWFCKCVVYMYFMILAIDTQVPVATHARAPGREREREREREIESCMKVTISCVVQNPHAVHACCACSIWGVY